MPSMFFRSVILSLLLALVLLCPVALSKVPIAEIGSNKIKLEVACTMEQIEHGLMERASMPENQGMVFLFRPTQPVRFWMFNCLMPLDMIFIKNGKIVKISRDVPPYKSADHARAEREAPRYPSDGEVEVSEVIEVNAGYCTRHGIKDADTVRFDLPGISAAISN